MVELYFVVQELPDGGYTAKAIGESIFTQGDSLDELKENIRDAVDCHYEEGGPKCLHLHIVRDEILSYA